MVIITNLELEDDRLDDRLVYDDEVEYDDLLEYELQNKRGIISSDSGDRKSLPVSTNFTPERFNEVSNSGIEMVSSEMTSSHWKSLSKLLL